jgi:hypothetical protein
MAYTNLLFIENKRVRWRTMTEFRVTGSTCVSQLTRPARRKCSASVTTRREFLEFKILGAPCLGSETWEGSQIRPRSSTNANCSDP